MMRVISVGFLSAAFLVGCAGDTASAGSSDEGAFDTKSRAAFSSTAAWDACAKEAIAEAEEACIAKGIAKRLCFGAAGRGAEVAATNACGPRPSPKALTPNMQESLETWCVTDGDFTKSVAFRRPWLSYADDSVVVELAKKECTRIFAKHGAESSGKRRTVEEKTNGLEIARLYAPASGYMTAVIKTDSEVRVKCALYDSAGTPLVVDEGTITPPVDELIMRPGAASSSVENVKCWRMR
jgi:hypothetical protein